MSQLVSAVMARDTSNIKIVDDSYSPLFQDIFYKSESIREIRTPLDARVYRLGVELGIEATVDEDQCDNLHLAIERCKRSIIEACFGEFREDFYRLENAIYDMDFAKAKVLLTEFQRKMFEVSK